MVWCFVSSEKSLKVLEEINIFHRDNEKLRNVFLFFFFVALCGYAAIIISNCPYNDDYWRYIFNDHVGRDIDIRYASVFLDIIFYFSNIITDNAPLSHVISCAFLAYIAIVFIKIFEINVDDKCALLCVIPIVVNPYLLECMMFRFDNPFMMLALLCSVLSAYLSCFNDKKLILMQVVLLLYSLFLYQPAISAYFIILLYCLLVELGGNKTLVSIVVGKRYFLYTLMITMLCYLPFISKITYRREETGDLFLIPSSLENIRKILKNIYYYIESLRVDWLYNSSGKIFFFLSVIFSIFFIIGVFKNIKNRVTAFNRSILTFLLLIVFFISPLGAFAFLCKLCQGSVSIDPRILYGFGILISLVLYKNYQSIEKYNFFKAVYVAYLACFGIWNVVFLNSAGNVLYRYKKLQEYVYYDIVKDISEILKNNNNFKYCGFRGNVYSQSLANFSQIYPIFDRVIPERWHVICYSRLSLLSHQFSDFITNDRQKNSWMYDDMNVSKKLLKSRSSYNLYSIDDNALFCQFDCDLKFECSPYRKRSAQIIIKGI